MLPSMDIQVSLAELRLKQSRGEKLTRDELRAAMQMMNEARGKTKLAQGGSKAKAAKAPPVSSASLLDRLKAMAPKAEGGATD